MGTWNHGFGFEAGFVSHGHDHDHHDHDTHMFGVPLFQIEPRTKDQERCVNQKFCLFNFGALDTVGVACDGHGDDSWFLLRVGRCMISGPSCLRFCESLLLLPLENSDL